jgi:hypothetical protein
LRANEAKIMQETKALYAELSALKRLLAVNGIPLPEPGSQAYSAISQDVTSPEQTFNLSIQFTSTKRKQQQISAQRSASHHHQYRHERSTGAANTHLVETIESSSFSHSKSFAVDLRTALNELSNERSLFKFGNVITPGRPSHAQYPTRTSR